MAPRLLAAAVPVLLAGWTFWPVTRFAFLNWDDGLVIVDNASLAGPDAWRWAFTTMHLEHYQPASWLVWAGVRRVAGVDAAAFHVLSLALHLLVTALVFLVARRLWTPSAERPDAAASGGGGTKTGPALLAAAAAALYALHPLRVEVVAWVSGMPYALATSLALASVLAWISRGRRPWLGWVSIGLYAMSLLARPVALGLPVVMVALDWWRGGRGRDVRRAMVAVAPALLLALLAAAAEAAARAPGLADVPWSYRLHLVAASPFVYAWRTLVPAGLTPLDALPLDPQGDARLTALAAFGAMAISAAFWVRSCQAPARLAAWVSYLALLAPAAGLVPSGLQATADRYTYLPGIVLTLGVVGGLHAWAEPARWRRLAAGAVVSGLVVASVVASRQYLAHWADSMALWTRVVEVQPGNDIGHYNLALALAGAGRADEAARHYQQALDVNPAHVEARANLDRLEAARLEAEGNALAARGDLAASAERYRQALVRDANRAHAHAARGMALATLGRGAEAVPHLREAMRLGVTDAAIPGALAALLAESGALDTARVVLEDGLRSHPDDAALAHNLARVLVATPELSTADRARALRLAEAVVRVTGGRDARALDTLAAALAANGRLAEARATSARAAALAEAQGDRDLAVQITARGRAYRDPGP